ncbi:MAG: methionyl-tRNA formyltransferase [Lactovum sp.]
MKKKLIFMGTIDFSAQVLSGLISDERYEIVAVTTQPDRKVGRKQILKVGPVKELALAHQIPVFQPEKLSNSKEIQELMALNADGIVTAAFGQFLPIKLLDSVDFAVNVHGSLLPWGRGGAPIQRAVMAGHQEIGISIIEMVKEMDAGQIISQAKIPLLDSDDSGTLFEKLAIVGRDLLLESLDPYISGELKPKPQEELGLVFTPNISPEEEQIDWTQSAQDIHNLIRALSPTPAAFCYYEGQRFKIYKSRKVEGKGEAGQVIERTKKTLIVATAKDALEILEVQAFGKSKMLISQFLNGTGREIKIGDRLG